MLVMYKLFLCVLTFVAYRCEFLLSFFVVALNGQLYSINMMVKELCVLKNYLTFVPLSEKENSYNLKHKKEFLKNKKIEITLCRMIRTLEVLIKKLIINKKLIKKWLVIVLPYFCLSQLLWSVMKSFSQRYGMKNLLIQNKLFI